MLLEVIFALNFNAWELAKLTATCYDGSPVAGSELQLDFDGTATNGEDTRRRTAYKIEISCVPNMNYGGATDMADVDLLIKNKRGCTEAD